MDELIITIYEITVNMDRALREEDFEEFDNQINLRTEAMLKVDDLKSNQPGYKYSEAAKRLFEEITLLEQGMTLRLQENISETKIALNQLGLKKQVSKKYLPYIKQTSGVFLDAKK